MPLDINEKSLLYWINIKMPANLKSLYLRVRDGRNSLIILSVLTLLAILPVTVFMAQQKQETRSKAAGGGGGGFDNGICQTGYVWNPYYGERGGCVLNLPEYPCGPPLVRYSEGYCGPDTSTGTGCAQGYVPNNEGACVLATGCQSGYVLNNDGACVAVTPDSPTGKVLDEVNNSRPIVAAAGVNGTGGSNGGGVGGTATTCVANGGPNDGAVFSPKQWDLWKCQDGHDYRECQTNGQWGAFNDAACKTGGGGTSPTTACRDNPVTPPSSAYVWKADCSAKTCTDNSGCPQNTSDPSNVNASTSNWCYNFGGAIGNKCLQLQRVSGSSGTGGTGTTGTNGTSKTSGTTSTPGKDVGLNTNYCAIHLAQPPKSFRVDPPTPFLPGCDAPAEIENAGPYIEGLWCKAKREGNDAMQKAVIACGRGADGCADGVLMNLTGRAPNRAGVIPTFAKLFGDFQARRSAWNYFIREIKARKVDFQAGRGYDWELAWSADKFFNPRADDTYWWGAQLAKESQANCPVDAWDNLCSSDANCTGGKVCDSKYGNYDSNHPPSFTCVPPGYTPPLGGPSGACSRAGEACRTSGTSDLCCSGLNCFPNQNSNVGTCVTSGSGGGGGGGGTGGTALAFSFKQQLVTAPKNALREVKVEIFDTSRNLVATKTTSATFKDGVFSGTADLGSLSSGSYVVKIKLNNTLRKNAEMISSLISGQTNTMPQVQMISGDVNNDNELSAVDYANLVGCLDLKKGTSGYSCADPTLSDLNDDGAVDIQDLGILIFNFSHRQGD